MADILTTTTQIDPAEQRFFQRVLLWGAYPALCYARFGQRAEIPEGEGDVCMWRRYTALATAKTPLGEGVTPPGKQLSKSDITAKMQQYGDFVLISDKVTVLNKERVLTVAAKKLSRQYGRTEDELTRDYLAACASSTDAANGANGDTPTEVTAADVDIVVQTLLGNDAPRITEIITGSAKVGTGPVDASYFGIFDTDLHTDFKNTSGWQKVSEYADPGKAVKDEVGALDYVRFLETSNGYVSSGTSDLGEDEYYIMIFGEDAYGIVQLGQRDVEYIVHGYGSGGVGDALNQRMTSGWKAWHGCRILNDNYMHILKVTKSA